MTTIVTGGARTSLVADCAPPTVVRQDRASTVVQQDPRPTRLTHEVSGALPVDRQRTRVLEVVQKGPKGDPGETEGATFNAAAAGPLHGRRVVCAGPGGLFHPDTAVAAHASQVVGLSVSSASGAGQVVQVRAGGHMEDSTWAWAPGYVFCGADGVLQQAPPPTGWVQRVARVISPTTLAVDIDTPIIRSD